MKTQTEYTINMDIFNSKNITSSTDEKDTKKFYFIFNENVDEEVEDKKFIIEKKWRLQHSQDNVKQNYKKRIIDMIKESEIEWGCISTFDRYLINNKNNKNLINNINEIFIENIDNADIVTKIFRAFSYLKYEDTYPNAQTMCLASLSVNNNEIKEAAIQLFEVWRNKEALELLKKINITENWLKKYAEQVMNEIEEELLYG